MTSTFSFMNRFRPSAIIIGLEVENLFWVRYLNIPKLWQLKCPWHCNFNGVGGWSNSMQTLAHPRGRSNPSFSCEIIYRARKGGVHLQPSNSTVVHQICRAMCIIVAPSKQLGPDKQQPGGIYNIFVQTQLQKSHSFAVYPIYFSLLTLPPVSHLEHTSQSLLFDDSVPLPCPSSP